MKIIKTQSAVSFKIHLPHGSLERTKIFRLEKTNSKVTCAGVPSCPFREGAAETNGQRPNDKEFLNIQVKLLL